MPLARFLRLGTRNARSIHTCDVTVLRILWRHRLTKRWLLELSVSLPQGGRVQTKKYFTGTEIRHTFGEIPCGRHSMRRLSVELDNKSGEIIHIGPQEQEMASDATVVQSAAPVPAQNRTTQKQKTGSSANLTKPFSPGLPRDIRTLEAMMQPGPSTGSNQVYRPQHPRSVPLVRPRDPSAARSTRNADPRAQETLPQAVRQPKPPAGLVPTNRVKKVTTPLYLRPAPEAVDPAETRAIHNQFAAWSGF